MKTLVTGGMGFVGSHTVVELFSIVIACGIFVLAWNSRRFHSGGYLLLLGVAYLFIAGLDLLHTLSYQGMDLLAGGGGNMASQVWLAARAIESGTLLAALLWSRKQFRPSRLLIVYGAMTVAVRICR